MHHRFMPCSLDTGAIEVTNYNYNLQTDQLCYLTSVDSLGFTPTEII